MFLCLFGSVAPDDDLWGLVGDAESKRIVSGLVLWVNECVAERGEGRPDSYDGLHARECYRLAQVAIPQLFIFSFCCRKYVVFGMWLVVT